jgi:hypothetical protein
LLISCLFILPHSCLALSDYLNIMQTDVSNSVFEELWTLCFRAIDDIKVR